jgi:hypothetical protein
MGQSKRKFEEVHYLEVETDYYKEMYSVFNNPKVRHIRADVKNEEFKDDELHDALLKTFLKAKKQLKTYEFNKRYNKL